MHGSVRLRPKHVQPVWAGHPWIFAQAIDSVEGAPAPGDAVSVVDPKGNVLGRGYWSPKSAIPIRILTKDANETLEAAFLGKALDRAAQLRRNMLKLPNDETTAYRLVSSEGDHLGGLVVDVYGKVAVVQFLTIGMKLREEDIFGHVMRVTGAHSVIEMSSRNSSKHEGFEAATRVARGPDVPVLHFRERGFEYELDMELAQKTGFYVDQRDNRALLESLVSGHRVLDAFSYVGAFALAAARGGAARVVSVDSSATAVAMGARHAEHHGFGGRIEFMRSDAKKALEHFISRGERFDTVILDPPKFAPTVRHLAAAQRSYRSLNAMAFRAVEKDGLFVSCSCSAAMTPSEFLRTLGMAARDAGREAALLHLGQQALDHPVPVSFPEGRYLKCAFLRMTH